MKYWIHNEMTGKWDKFTDHDGKHCHDLRAKGKFVTQWKPVQALTSKEIHQIMTNQSWDGIK